MKHIVIFQGVKYISSKRASKISGYSSDYIGQLCRAEKLRSRMIGHTWFIAEESMLAYKENIDDDAMKSFTSGASNAGSEKEKAKVENEIHADRLSTKQASRQFGYTSDYIGQLCRGGKLDCRMVGNTWYITRESLKKHQAKIQEEKDRTVEPPLLPVLNKSRPSYAQKETESVFTESTHSDFRPKRKAFAETITRRSSLIRSVAKSMVAAVFFIAVVSASVGLIAPSESAPTGESQNANALDAVERVFAYFGEAVGSVIAYFTHSSDSGMHIATTEGQPSSESQPSSNFGGMAVAPSTGSTTEDQSEKAQIESSFSDQVDVKPDMNGEAGVITPVFKASKGNDFVYVLVPVKE